MSPRAAADDRLRRLLAVVPWVASHDGPKIADVCNRFGCTKEELLADLDLLVMCGVYPFSPDMLIEVDVTRGRVWIRYADWFSRPLRLTPAEGLALVAAGAALLAAPGVDGGGPLATALAKLAATLGVDPEESMDVELGEARPEVLTLLRAAVAERLQVRMDYYSFGRDTWTTRVIEPHGVFSSAGQWYVAAYCHTAHDPRLFRLDRIRDPEVVSTTFDRPATAPPTAVYNPRDTDPRIVLDVDAASRWVAEQYPVESVEERADGGQRLVLRWSERAWLERLLLRLGPHATVVDGDAAVGPAAAGRVLARYRVGAP